MYFIDGISKPEINKPKGRKRSVIYIVFGFKAGVPDNKPNVSEFNFHDLKYFMI
jgi:hypothetical protein